jgi:hypothetical protein
MEPGLRRLLSIAALLEIVSQANEPIEPLALEALASMTTQNAQHLDSLWRDANKAAGNTRAL